MSAPTDTASHRDRRPLTIKLERGADAPARAREAVADFCRERDVAPSALATLRLLVSELVTNAVIHPDVERRATITVRAWLARGTVHVEVQDPGRRFVPRSRDPSRVDGGYGLYLVAREAARWGLGPGPTTTVWFEVAGSPA